LGLRCPKCGSKMSKLGGIRMWVCWRCDFKVIDMKEVMEWEGI